MFKIFFHTVRSPRSDTYKIFRLQLVINGDVESNPGPIASALAHRIAIGRYYSKAAYLSYGLYNNIDVCFCQKYEESISKHSGYNFLTMIEFFDNNLLEKHHEYTPKDLEFCIATIELVYDVSLSVCQFVSLSVFVSLVWSGHIQHF